MKKFWAVTLIFMMLYPTFYEFAYAATTIGPDPPTNVQTLTKEVFGEAPANPGVYWYQSGGNPPGYRYWVADLTDGGEVTSDNTNSGGKSYPQAKQVSDFINLDSWKPSEFSDPETGSKYSSSKIVSGSLEVDGPPTFIPADSYSGVSVVPTGGSRVNIITTTGYGYTPSTGPKVYKVGYDGYDMWEAMYETPLNVNWKAKIKETKEIDVLSNTVIPIGGSYQATAQVRTQNFGESSWSSWVNVSSRTSEITWKSSNSGVATVGSTGNITGGASGSAVITAVWKSGFYELQDTITVTVGSGSLPTDSGSKFING